MNKLYLVIVFGDISPELQGPYKTEEERDKAAIEHRRKDSDREDGIYLLDISGKGEPEIDSYTGGFLDSIEEAVEVEEGAA